MAHNLAPNLRCYVEPSAHAYDMVAALQAFRQPSLNVIRMCVRPESVPLCDWVRVAMLWKYVVRFEFINQRDRIINLHVVFGRRYEQHVDVLDEKLILQQDGITWLHNRLATQVKHIPAIVEIRFPVHGALSIAV